MPGLEIARCAGHTDPMLTRSLLTLLSILFLGLAVSGCSGCGWWWDDLMDNLPKNCRSDRLPQQK